MNINTICLLAIISILQLGCKKEGMNLAHKLIAEGCIPNSIILDEPLLGGYNDIYKYENGKLTQFGDFIYEYENGLVKRIRLGQDRYEEYIYDLNFKIIQSVQYRRDDPKEGFKVVDDMEYIYNDSLIVKAIDNDDNMVYKISYHANTNNIDTIKTFNANSELTELRIFKYDQFSNVFKNLLMPKFNFFWWLEKNSNNNVAQHKIVKLLPQNKTTIFNRNFKYNNYNYPIEIKESQVNSTYATKTTISYINCK